MNLEFALISFLLGYFSQKILDKLYNKFTSYIKIKKLRQKMVKIYFEMRRKDDNIIELATGYPFFTEKNIILSVIREKSFFLSFPRELFHKIPSISQSFSEKDIIPFVLSLKNTPKDQILKQLEQSRYKIAQAFVNRENGLYFNGKKYGIYKVDGFSRTHDSLEIPQLSMQLFETDYFTHRVILDVITELKIHENEITFESLNNKLNWTRTGFGVGVIILLKTNQLVLAQRAKTAAYSEGVKNIVLGVSEGFTETDYDKYNATPELSLCVKRALLEELGITYSMYETKGIKFLDFFYEVDYYQSCAIALVELEDEVSFSDIIQSYKNAKDSLLETDSIFLIDADKKSILSFIEENNEKLRPQTIFALKCYIEKKDLISHLAI